jgi:hypothetical protein
MAKEVRIKDISSDDKIIACVSLLAPEWVAPKLAIAV